MFHQKQVLQFYLFSLSNFIAAFGGGMILGKGVGVIGVPFLQSGSIFAFFVGTVLGLVFLQIFPKKHAQTLAPWFSFLGASFSIFLLFTFKKYANHGVILGKLAYLFFMMLSMRFGFWFYSRVSRAAAAAGKNQSIAWVELGYYTGIILGLIIWDFSGINITIAHALLIDIFVQLLAGLLDIYAAQLLPQTSASNKNKITSRPDNNILKLSIKSTKHWGWRLALAIVSLTVGIQVVIFDLAHLASKTFGSYILATFYLGVALAALVCKKLNVQLKWQMFKKNNIAYAKLYSNNNELNSLIFYFCIVCCVISSIVSIHYWASGNSYEKSLILLFVLGAAFFYEVLVLAFLDKIGQEEQLGYYSGMVMQTYGLMGITAAISLWILNITQSQSFGLCTTLLATVLFAIVMIWKRKHPIPD